MEPGYQKEEYKRFAPGGCYILPKENILQHPKSFYEKLFSFVDYTRLPPEVWLIERDLYHIFQFKELYPKQKKIRNRVVRKVSREFGKLKSRLLGKNPTPQKNS